MCIPFNRIHLAGYGIGPVAECFTVHDLKTKKINPIVSINNVEAEHLNFKFFKTNNGTKIFFIYFFENSSRYLQTAIFNIDKNIFEKVSQPAEIKQYRKFNLFQLENQDIIVTEDNAFKYIFDTKKQELKPLRNYGFRMREGANVLPLNNYQVLITGGYTINDSKNYSLKDTKVINGNEYHMIHENIISKSAYIYSF